MVEKYGFKPKHTPRAVTGTDLFYTGLFCLIVAAVVGIMLWREFA